MKHIFFLFFVGFTQSIIAQDVSGDSYLRHPIDVQTYDVNIVLSDKNDEIHVTETIHYELKTACDSFFIDLQSLHDGKGMTIKSLTTDFEEGDYNHRNNRVWIKTQPHWVGTVREITIDYSGVPETGLIIGQNKFGDRTFFGDNWPNRAHHWIACVDHPSDKALVNFTVVAPKKYDVIATGTLQKEEDFGAGKRLYRFRSAYQLPTKVMVIGVADFETKELTPDPGFPITAWVYPQDAEKGFKDMQVALDVTTYFMEIIGEYPYEKLANVQSTTQFGGMENAGNIFYDENAVTGENTMVGLIAHEIAHQWFGNSASESDWQHLWLSEGFATYFTDIYWEHTYGTDAMNERLKSERNRVLSFAKSYDHPVIDETPESLMNLLNPNSYQKGAWVLHMLRTKIGDEAFFEGIRTYYERHKYANAETTDLMEVMQNASGEDLSQFFEQWLRTPGHPILHIATTSNDHGIEFVITQTQKSAPFTFDLEVEIIYEDGRTELTSIPVMDSETSFDFDTSGKVAGLRYDPNVTLLFEQVEY